MKRFILALIIITYPVVFYGQWTPNGNHIYYPASGNVGIGTSTPGSKLTIDGVDGYANGITLQQSSAYQHLITAYADGNNPASGSALQFRVANNATGGNVPVMTLKGSGFVGVGTVSPRTWLDVSGYVYVNRPAAMIDGGTTFGGGLNIVPANLSATNPGYVKFEYTSDGFKIGTDYDGHISTVGNNFKNILFGRANGGDNYMIIKDGGNIGMGTDNPGDYRLAVNGNVKARKIVISVSGWSDYVFNADYQLRSIPALTSFIRKNKHLPDIPSARDVQEKGIDLGDTQALLLKKIEELTLYLIKQDEKINHVIAENRKLKRMISRQR